MRIFILSIFILAAGCASLKDEVFENIHEGDTAYQLTELLGNPDSFGESQRTPGAKAWYYVRRGSTCGFTIEDQTITYITCSDNPNYVPPTRYVGSVLKGMGDGLKSAVDGNQKNVNCTTQQVGDSAYTNCR